MPYLKLRSYWSDAAPDAQFLAGDEGAISALEKKYLVQLPQDFRDYLLHSSPAQEFMDSQAVAWWPINGIKNIPDEYLHRVENDMVARESSKYLFFADFGVWCSAWAISYSDGESRGEVV